MPSAWPWGRLLLNCHLFWPFGVFGHIKKKRRERDIQQDIPNAWLRSSELPPRNRSYRRYDFVLFNTREGQKWYMSKAMASLCLNSLPRPPPSQPRKLVDTSFSSLASSSIGYAKGDALKPIVVSGDPPTFVSAPGRRIVAGLFSSSFFSTSFSFNIYKYICVCL